MARGELAECAGVLGGAPAFWQAIDQIFDRTRSNGEGFNGHLNVVGVTNQALLSCATTDRVIAQHVGQQAAEAIKAEVTATPTVIIRDNTTGRTIKLEGPADGLMLLSAIDWLAQIEDQQDSKSAER